MTGIYVENDRVAGLRSSTLLPSDASNAKGTRRLGIDAPQRVDEEVMSTLTNKAVGWLEQQDASQPFFLYYAPVAVHEPVTPSSETRGTSKAGSFGDWIHELDASVGRVLDALDRKGLTQDTLVLFTSDNGGVNEPTQQRPETDAIRAGLKPNGPLRGGKVSVYEGGFRVPYLLRWPGHVQAGTVSGEMLSVVDTLATVAAIVGEPLPPATLAAEDSYNILAAWTGTKLPGGESERPLRPDMITHSCFGNFAIRQGKWKYIEGKPPADLPPRILKIQAKQFQPQLYNLVDDPKEEHNLLGEQKEVAERLQARLDQQRQAGYSRPANDGK
jgi:arylsulfatase A-like enzyme